MTKIKNIKDDKKSFSKKKTSKDKKFSFSKKTPLKNKHKTYTLSREGILSCIKKSPASENELVRLLDVKGPQRKKFISCLRSLIRDSQIICNAKGVYRVFSNKHSVTGTIVANPKGFGFITLDKGGKDLRLTEKQMQFVFHGDKVKARRINRRGDAEIIQVTEHAKHLVGRLHKEKKSAYVVLDDRRIKHKISILKLPKKYKNGQIVSVEILKSPTLKKPALGKVVDILGDYMGEGVETTSALHRYHIPVDFSDKSLEKNGRISDEISLLDKKNRVDLTKLKLVTIDGDDARDLDDAVYAEETLSGWRVVVAIADVSHYVKEDSELDKEAFNRGNSVYFPRRVVPMLPEKLSNDLCSLNPKVERLCLTCDMQINTQGELIDYKFYSAFMSSYARLTYDQVSKIVDEKEPELRKEYEEVIGNLDSLYELYQILKSAKKRRGVIDFDRSESRLVFNDNGKIKNIVGILRNDAHKLIEELMLKANQATAKFLENNKESFLYRIHPRPTAEKIKSTRKFLHAVGLELGGDLNPESKDFLMILEEAKKRKDENIIKTVILRTMMQAHYTPENEGHFGLSFDSYTHFTSPIRRYPDLIAHRAIKRIINKDKKNNNKGMIEQGAHLSITERRADDASRDVERWLKCEYIRKQTGEIVDGIISGVSSFGLYVELDGFFVEGMIGVSDLKGDYYIFDESLQQLKGKKTKKIFKLGNPLRVKIVSVSLDDRRISLVLAKKVLTTKQSKGQRVKKGKNKSHDDYNCKENPKKIFWV